MLFRNEICKLIVNYHVHVIQLRLPNDNRSNRLRLNVLINAGKITLLTECTIHKSRTESVSTPSVEFESLVHGLQWVIHKARFKPGHGLTRCILRHILVRIIV